MKESTKSSIKRKVPFSEFRALFEDSITVKAIYEDLYCVRWLDNAQHVFTTLKNKEFDVAGISKSENGPICGYIRRQDLTDGTCGTHALRFDETLLMSDSTPLIKALYLLGDQPYWFILKDTSIESIVTKADLQKPPVRILIFGIITLLEMNLTELIRKLYEESDWIGKLSLSRVKTARELMQHRQDQNEQIDLLECTQLCDKRDLIKHSKEACRILGFSSKTEAENRLKPVISIRNRVAHGQDLVSGSIWEEVTSTIKDAEQLIKKCEVFLDG